MDIGVRFSSGQAVVAESLRSNKKSPTTVHLFSPPIFFSTVHLFSPPIFFSTVHLFSPPIFFSFVLCLSATAAVPTFKGFEDSHYQQFDAKIEKAVREFNASRGTWAGATADQAKNVDALTVEQVKAHMLQESGGSDMKSRVAWTHDPLQVNVPGDWSEYKRYLGIKKPRHRNEGSFEKNLKAALRFLSRKGFGVSGQPAANRPEATFDGWARALQRYNGRTDKAKDGKVYSESYSERIRRRAEDPSKHVPISL